jgi:hypothetical protein
VSATEILAELADDAARLVFEHERAEAIGTEPPPLNDLRDLAGALAGVAMDDEPECDCFEELRWPLMSQAERRRVLTWLRARAGQSGDNEHSMALDAVVEALQRVCETEGVV